MIEQTSFWVGISVIGLLTSSVGGLGGELLDRFAGRPLEVYCRVRKNRDRFFQIIDHQDKVIEASEYFRIIGTALFLIAGTSAIFVAVPNGESLRGTRLLFWILSAGGTMMLVHSWLPTAVTRFASTKVLYHTWPLWLSLGTAMSPLSAPGKIFQWAGRRMSGKKPPLDNDEEQLEDEIRTIVTAGYRKAYFAKDIREMIDGVMTLDDEDVRHIMTPRTDVDGLDVSWEWPEVLEAVVQAGRTRFPVYRDSLDNVVGVLYVKDVLPLMARDELGSTPLESVLRKPWTVPDNRPVDVILREFLHSRSHMAIVLDEHQRMVGVVTIEDALEEIVGEIVDESDEEEAPTIELIDDVTVVVDGRVMMDDLNESTDWDVPESEEYETIAGFVLYHLGLIPDTGAVVTIGDLTIEVQAATHRKIERMKITCHDSQNQMVG